jgi:acetyl esterase/lipase
MESEWIMRTYTYKVVEECKIQADVYQAGSRKNQPVIVWIHGGALIGGSRSAISPYQLRYYLESGFTVVSIDYRLAPETKLPGIIEDLQDAIQWVRVKGPDLAAIESDRIAVIGHSAGGYLALMAGFCINPPPQAIVSFYGYGDIIGPWYSRPDLWYCQQEMIPMDQAYVSVGHLPLSESTGDKRFLFYRYCRQHGLWPQEVAGQDPHQNPAWFAQYCPIRNITARFAPSLLIHGDQDTDVPYGQSVEMDTVLEQHRVSHQLLTMRGRGHGFDGAADAAEDPAISHLFIQVAAFLKQHCK